MQLVDESEAKNSPIFGHWVFCQKFFFACYITNNCHFRVDFSWWQFINVQVLSKKSIEVMSKLKRSSPAGQVVHRTGDAPVPGNKCSKNISWNY